MKPTTRTAAADMFAAITKVLDLESRTISFHIINDQDMSGGMIFDADGLSRSDAWLDLAEAYSLDQYVSCDVTTYTLGRGETDHATASDLVTLDHFRQSDPAAWDAMLWEFCDMLSDISNLSAENPFYIDDDETEEE